MHTDVFFHLILLPIAGAALYGVVELALQRWPVLAGLGAAAASLFSLGNTSLPLALLVAALLVMRAAWIVFRAGRRGPARPRAGARLQALGHRLASRRDRTRRARSISKAQWVQASRLGGGAAMNR